MQAYLLPALQANAEPDMKQTGQRLQGIIAGLVEGILQLVADPLTAEQVMHAACSYVCK